MRDMHRTKPTSCLACGYLLDAASSFDEKNLRRPRKGDASICVSCGNLAIYAGKGGALRAPTEEELAALHDDEHVKKLTMAVRIVNKRRMS